MFRNIKRIKQRVILQQQLGYRMSKVSGEMNRLSEHPFQCNPLEAPVTLKLNIMKDKRLEYEVSRLQSGVTVVTEQQGIPSMVDLGILIGTGTRDESVEQSGALLAIKQNYLRTNDSHDGVANLEYLYQSGGYLDMEYDQENTYFKGQFLMENLHQSLELLVKCALQQKTQVDFQLVQSMIKEQDYTLDDLTLKQAFGGGEWKGLGMPLLGIRDNYENHLDVEALSRFYQEHYSLDKVWVGASGVDHQTFCRLVEDTVGQLSTLVPTAQPTQPSVYQGGRLAFHSSNATNLAYKHLDQETLDKLPEDLESSVVFESFNWSADQIVTLNVVYTLLGNSQSFSSGGPGKGMHSRTTRNLLNNTYFINSAAAINTLFTDSGVFGLQASGNYNQGTQIVQAICNELRGLLQVIPQQELDRAKNILKSNVNLVLQRQQDRLEETIKNIRLTGEIGHDKYNDKIAKVTTEDINNNMQKMFATEPTYVTRGKHIDNLPNLEDVKNMVKS